MAVNWCKKISGGCVVGAGAASRWCWGFWLGLGRLAQVLRRACMVGVGFVSFVGGRSSSTWVHVPACGGYWVHELWGMAVWLGLGHPARVCEPQGLGVGSPVGPGLPGALGLPYNRCQVCKLWGQEDRWGPGYLERVLGPAHENWFFPVEKMKKSGPDAHGWYDSPRGLQKTSATRAVEEQNRLVNYLSSTMAANIWVSQWTLRVFPHPWISKIDVSKLLQPSGQSPQCMRHIGTMDWYQEAIPHGWYGGGWEAGCDFSYLPSPPPKREEEIEN